MAIPSIVPVVSNKVTMKNVKIIVYDIAGKEIAILANTVMNPGKYVVDWNANDARLSSGVYFYRITAGSFVEVKKMMLIK